MKPSENDVLSKYKTQKSRLLEMGIGEEHQTEDEIMENMGYLKVYDAGNKVRYFWFNGFNCYNWFTRLM